MTVMGRFHIHLVTTAITAAIAVSLHGRKHTLYIGLCMYHVMYLHRICEAETIGNCLNVGLRADYLSVRTVGGASN